MLLLLFAVILLLVTFEEIPKEVVLFFRKSEEISKFQPRFKEMVSLTPGLPD